MLVFILYLRFWVYLRGIFNWYHCASHFSTSPNMYQKSLIKFEDCPTIFDFYRRFIYWITTLLNKFCITGTPLRASKKTTSGYITTGQGVSQSRKGEISINSVKQLEVCLFHRFSPNKFIDSTVVGNITTTVCPMPSSPHRQPRKPIVTWTNAIRNWKNRPSPRVHLHAGESSNLSSIGTTTSMTALYV